MRRGTLLIAGMLAVTAAGCGTTEPAAHPSPEAAPPVVSSSPVLESNGSARVTVLDGSGAVPPGAGLPAVSVSAAPLGRTQDIRTPDLAAKVTVSLGWSPADEAGDPAYVIDVSVRVQRGTWQFGPSLVRLRYAGGTESGPIEGGSSPAGGMTLHTGAATTWHIPYEHSAGVGIGQGATIIVVDESGTVLATWTT
ncbi:hypothetical protein [Actinoplanes sp. NPDC051851]|uniref:hypothetical protein n=1 Tax=Actinoplanes sp. NPDC051851 TaxID=3154753 RepID=UPI00342836D1